MAETATNIAQEQTDESASAPVDPNAPVAVLRDRYLVDSGQPLPELDTPNARAYAASDKNNPEQKLFALICTPSIPARTNGMMRLKSLKVPGLLSLVEWDSMDWPPLGQQVMTLVYERPLGGRLSDVLANGTTRINEYDIVRRILQPAMGAIEHMANHQVTHRAIRPDNMFFMDEDRAEIVFGDCLTSPPAFDQPVIFESIERSTAKPIGRGPATMLEDLYSLGVSMILTLLGHNPTQEMSDLEILSAKVLRGSYAAVCGNSRVPLSMIEVLRGLLSDEEETRWSIEDVETWIDGRKRTPIQRRGQPKANSPYMFQTHPHSSPRTLAYSFAQAPDEAFRVLKSDENLISWIHRGLQNEELSERVKALIEQAGAMQGSPAAAPDVIISRVCALLDPAGPIRYKDAALMPDALGHMLAHEILAGNKAQTISEIINLEVYETWFKSQTNNSPDHVLWHRMFVQCRSFLKINDLGYGLERCLYELNSNLPCQSPLVIDDYITDIDFLLPAVDRAASHVEHDTRPIDRHITAFIAARFTEDIHPHLKALASPEPERSIIGLLSLYAFLQWKIKTDAVLGLASWLGGLLGPAINTYHNRSTRRDLEREIPQLVRKGSLPELFDLIDNAERRGSDENGFTAAQEEFLQAEESILEIEGREGEKESKLLKSGQKTSAMFAILLSMIIVFMLVLLSGW